MVRGHARCLHISPRLGLAIYNQLCVAHYHGNELQSLHVARDGQCHCPRSTRADEHRECVVYFLDARGQVRFWYLLRIVDYMIMCVFARSLTPTYSIAREPRWGRNIESPGEDPYLVGEYAISFTKGFQEAPEDPTHLMASACCKHYVANEMESTTQNGIHHEYA